MYSQSFSSWLDTFMLIVPRSCLEPTSCCLHKRLHDSTPETTEKPAQQHILRTTCLFFLTTLISFGLLELWYLLLENCKSIKSRKNSPQTFNTNLLITTSLPEPILLFTISPQMTTSFTSCICQNIKKCYLPWFYVWSFFMSGTVENMYYDDNIVMNWLGKIGNYPKYVSLFFS